MWDAARWGARISCGKSHSLFILAIGGWTSVLHFIFIKFYAERKPQVKVSHDMNPLKLTRYTTFALFRFN